MLAVLLAGCNGDDPAITITDADITAQFDAKFAALLKERGYIPNAKKITPADVKEIKKIDVSVSYEQQGDLTSLSGIEYFSALDTLICYNNQLTALDVSKNTALTILQCADNQLTALDVSKNTALIGLYCFDNQLTALDVSKNTVLAMLHCFSNQLTALDVSKNTALTELWCGANQLTVLDVSKNTVLTILQCGANQLTVLDVSKNTALTILQCASNQLTALDVSKNTALTELWCHINPGNGTIFPITAWFDNDSIPRGFPADISGIFGGAIAIDYIKVD